MRDQENNGCGHKRLGRVFRALATPAIIGATCLAVLGAGAQAASAGQGTKGGFPMSYSPDTVAPWTNTYTPPTSTLSPQCPNGLAGTPGSDPANLALNAPQNNAMSFEAGGTVYFVYSDNPHGSAFGFTIQDCMVVYPESFFTSSDFDPTTGVLTSNAFNKSSLDHAGTMIDGAALTGISSPEGQIYFGWTLPSTATTGSWVCSFARDIRTDHGGGGNRKVTPTCFQVGGVTTT